MDAAAGGDIADATLAGLLTGRFGSVSATFGVLATEAADAGLQTGDDTAAASARNACLASSAALRDAAFSAAAAELVLIGEVAAAGDGEGEGDAAEAAAAAAACSVSSADGRRDDTREGILLPPAAADGDERGAARVAAAGGGDTTGVGTAPGGAPPGCTMPPFGASASSVTMLGFTKMPWFGVQVK